MRRAWPVFGALAALAGCGTFSSWQSARLLAPGKTSVTAAGAYARGEGADYLAAEALVRHGVTPSFEAGAQLSHLRDLDDASVTLLYLDAKVSLLPDELALQLPVGVGWRQDAIHDVQLAPTLIGTATLSPAVSADVAAKVIVIADDEHGLTLGKVNLALTGGLRFRSDAWPFEVAPQVGVMLDDVNDHYGGDVAVVAGGGVAVTWLP